MSTMIKNLLVGRGYAESAGFSFVAVHHDQGFQTPEEFMKAFIDTITACLSQFPKPRICCSQTKELIPDAEYCAKCGISVRRPTRVSQETIIGWFYASLVQGVNDGFEDDEFFRENGWSFGEFPTGKSLLLYSFDQWVKGYDKDLARVINVIHPGKHTV